MEGEADTNGRKRKSRWGDEQKKSRWGTKKENPASVMDALNNLSPEQKELYAVRLKLAQVSQRLMALEQNPDVDPTPIEERSPSPEPTYDKEGMRTNLRPVRTKAKLMAERTALLEQAVALNPVLASTVALAKKSRKVFLPQDSSENNFIGLIIGPRGNTQKRLEKETGAKISIRGKGAHKNNKFSQTMGPQPGDDEELHVLVVGDTDDIVDAAAKHLEELLNPLSALSAEHRQKQLRELATANGITLTGIVCRACGAEGHKLYECPNREKSWQPANVHCNICGSGTHPDKDCTAATNSTLKTVTEEYSKFISELSGQADDDEVAKATTAVQRAMASGDVVVTGPSRAVLPLPSIATSDDCAPGEEGLPDASPAPSRAAPAMPAMAAAFPFFPYGMTYPWVAPC